ncbi:hypothetical protein [Methylorubrum extorquens]
MARFICGADRHQVTLLPNRLDNYVSEDNPARVVDLFVDELDLMALDPPPLKWSALRYGF